MKSHHPMSQNRDYLHKKQNRFILTKIITITLEILKKKAEKNNQTTIKLTVIVKTKTTTDKRDMITAIITIKTVIAARIILIMAILSTLTVITKEKDNKKMNHIVIIVNINSINFRRSITDKVLKVKSIRIMIIITVLEIKNITNISIRLIITKDLMKKGMNMKE